tara:strand:- start:1519 stop:2334 length:816 start_codon:yes stop_codon:yes gene_type:complete
MEARLQLRVQRYGWDAAAVHYDDAWAALLTEAQLRTVEAADLAPGHAVIETACGSGMVTEMIARRVGPRGRVMATDLSEKMVRASAKRCTAAGYTNVELARMGAETLEVPDAAFDRAICALGLMYVPEPCIALDRVRRALRPGGRIAVLVWGERRKCGWAEIFPITDAEVKSETCPLFFALGTPGALSIEMERAGFREPREHRLSTLMHFPDGESLLRAVIDGGAVALAARRFSPETRTRVDGAFLESVDAYRTSEGYDIPGEFVVATAIK